MIKRESSEKTTRTRLVKVLKNYDRIYYISLFINFLVIVSIFFELVFIFIIENNYLFAFISLVTSAVLAIISFGIKFIFNNVVSELLIYLMDKEDNTREHIAENLERISMIIRMLGDKVPDDGTLIQILQLFDFTNKKETKSIKVEESNDKKVANDNK